MIYKLIPRVRIAWRDVWVGAAVTAALFAVGKFLIGLYLGKSSVASAFGAAGSLVVMMVWVYYSAQIFLLGAEFTWVFAHTLRLAPRRAPAAPGGLRTGGPGPSDGSGRGRALVQPDYRERRVRTIDAYLALNVLPPISTYVRVGAYGESLDSGGMRHHRDAARARPACWPPRSSIQASVRIRSIATMRRRSR